MSNDLYPTKLVVKNLYCFRGTHVIVLDATVYAVLAQAVDNPARSNWLGKSTLLMAFAFALFGWHTKRTDEEIITHGENEASVEMWLNDGSKLARIKTLGKSMQIRFTAKGKKAITQARAQDAIEVLIGFTKDDFFATCFFEQKQIGALVTAKGAERSAMVEGWLAEELEPIQRLHGATVREHKAAIEALRELEEEATNLEVDWGQLMEERVGQPSPKTCGLLGHLQAQVDLAEQAQVTAKQELKAVHTELATKRADVEAWTGKVAQAKKYECLVEQGVATREAFDALPADTAEKRKVAEAATCQAITEYDEAAKHLAAVKNALYQFDGMCPIACQECPSTQWVREQASSPEAVAVARQELEQADTARKAALKASQAAIALDTKRSTLERNLVQLRAQAEQLMDVAEEVAGAKPPDCTELEVQVQRMEAEVEERTERLRLLREDIVWATKATARRQELSGLLVAAKERAQVAAEAVEITGRTGAQQAVQELVMAKVERRANKLLGDAGIPLQVAVSWGQETKGLAKVCGQCGTAFPTSQRVKECPACGTARGPNVQRKLTIEPSNRSGAAEDLAGISLGIAASQWLRAARGSRWATVFIDEPFGALDPHNRTALGGHIVGMLRTAFASAFVVAHERAILHAMPARINILAGPDGSQIQGEAA